MKRTLKKTNDLKAKLLAHKIEINHQSFSKSISTEEFQTAINQFLIQRLFSFELNQKLYYAIEDKKQIIHPLPPQWRRILKSEGLKIPTITNAIIWFFFKFKWFLYGVVLSFRVLLSNLSFFREQIDTPFVYLDNLTEKNFPADKTFDKAKNIINWVINFHDFKSTSIIYWFKGVGSHKILTNQIKSIPYAVTSNSINLWSFIFLCGKLVYHLIYLISKLLLSSSLSPLLMKEYGFLLILDDQKKNNLASHYYFHGSTLIFRPLWTYIVEKRESEVICFLYSTHNSPYSFEGKFDLNHGYRNESSWNNFYTWNKFQKEYFAYFRPNAKFFIVGPIWFEAFKSPKINPKSNKLNILILDIRPLEKDKIKFLGMAENFNFSEEYLISYIRSLVNTLTTIEGVEIFYKSKRSFVENFHSKNYQKAVNNIFEEKIISNVDPNTDIFSLIQEVDIIFCPPFVSAANIAQDMNKATAYFDPSKKILPNAFLAHGNKILYTEGEIREFVETEKYKLS